MEFESFFDGTLLHIGVEKSKAAPVNAILAIIGSAGEDISSLLVESPIVEEKVAIPSESSDKAQVVVPVAASVSP